MDAADEPLIPKLRDTLNNKRDPYGWVSFGVEGESYFS